MIHMHHIQNYLMDRHSFKHGHQPRFFSFKGVQNAFLVGSAVHEAITRHYLNLSPIWGKDFKKLQTKIDQVIAMTTTHGYLSKYKDERFHSWKNPHIGIRFKGYNLAGKPDLTARTYSQNKLVIVELKTSAVEAEQGKTLNFQTMYYAWLYYKRYNEIPIAVIKRTLKKPRIRQKKNETDGEYINRIVVDVAEKEDKYFLSGSADINIHKIRKFELYLIEILKEMYEKNQYKFYKNPMEVWP